MTTLGFRTLNYWEFPSLRETSTSFVAKAEGFTHSTLPASGTKFDYLGGLG